MDSAKVFGQGIKVAETDKLNIDSIIARLLEGKRPQKIIFLRVLLSLMLRKLPIFHIVAETISQQC